MVRYEYGLLGHGTLKYAVSQERINELSWFFACSYIVKKAKSYFNSYWVHLVKYDCNLLGRGTLKSALSQEQIDGLGWFFACMLEVMQ